MRSNTAINLNGTGSVSSYAAIVAKAKQSKPDYDQEVSNILKFAKVNNVKSKMFTALEDVSVSSIFTIDNIDLSKDLVSEEFQDISEIIANEMSKLNKELAEGNDSLLIDVDFWIPRLREKATQLHESASQKMNALTEGVTFTNRKDDPAWGVFDIAMKTPKK